MEDQKALNIVTALANGVNPQTGEVFPGDSPYQSAEIVRALFVAIRAMQAHPAQRRRPDAPANAGKPWTEAEDAALLQEFDRGLEIAAIAQAHARTPAGIQARLERHGRLLPQIEGRPSQRVPRGGHHGTGGVADRPANGRANRDPGASLRR
jgi:hypothetical protein